MSLNPDRQLSGQAGFTLIEIAVVLVIIGLLVGSFIGSFAERIETSRRSEVSKQLEDIRLSLYAFASTNGRLPCPATAASGGVESPAGGVCNQQHGFLPGVSLGLDGRYDQNGRLLDAWGNPYRFSVTTANGSAFTRIPGAGGIRDVGMAALGPDLVICDGFSTSATACAGSNSLTTNAVFMVLSTGKDGAQAPAANSDQSENADFDNVFVAKTYVEQGATADVFDDMLVWGSPYILYAWMLQAGQLP